MIPLVLFSKLIMLSTVESDPLLIDPLLIDPLLIGLVAAVSSKGGLFKLSVQRKGEESE
jgi:hypothetical protein